MSDFAIDGKELLKRILKYVFEGPVVAFAAFFIPGKSMSAQEIIIIGVVAAATFSMLDLVTPNLSNSVRNGAGMGIGFNLVGTNMVGGGAPMIR